MDKLIPFLKNIYHWVRQDGLLHILVSQFLMVALGWIHPVWIPVLVVLAVGIGKEVYDKLSGKGTPEWHDIICDLIGIAIGLGLVLLLTHV